MQVIAKMNDKKAALEIAYRYASIDCAHHKAWVIDQMVRKLTGDSYKEWVRKYEASGEYEWSVGIAP